MGDFLFVPNTSNRGCFSFDSSYSENFELEIFPINQSPPSSGELLFKVNTF